MRFFSRFLSAQTCKSFADVTRRKGRTLLVVLGIFIGVAGLTSINFTETALYNAFAFTSGVNADQPDIFLSVDKLDLSLRPTLAAVPNVRAVQYESHFETFWHTSASTKTLLLITSYPNLQQVPITPFQITSGRYPGVGEVVMEYGDQALHPFALGDLVTVETAQGTAKLRVVGLARTPGRNPAASGDASAYMSESGLAQLAAGAPRTAPESKPPSFNQMIAVKVHDHNKDQATAAALQQALQDHGVTVLNVDIPGVNNNAAMLKAIEGIFGLLRLLAIIAVILSGILILNTITALVAEQMAIIGSMKAAGGTRGVILRGYLVSVVIYAALGTLPGLALGLFGGYQFAVLLAQQATLDIGPFTVAPWIVALSLAVGFIVPLLAAFLPLWNGTRITVREALSGYGVSSVSGTGQGAFAGLGQRLNWVSQTTWLGLRGIFRKRLRLALTLLTLAVAGTSFLVVQTATTSVNDTVGAENAQSSADMAVYFKDATIYNQISGQLQALPNVARIERYGTYNVTTAWGTVAVFGYEAETQIYHYQLTSGRWLRPGDTNVVLLSDDVAAKTGLHIGDTLIVNGHTSLTVIGTLKQSISVLGWIGAVVMPVSMVYELRGMPAATATIATTEVIIEARDHDRQSVYSLAQNVNKLVNPTDGYGDGTGYFSGGNGTVDTSYEYITRRQQDWYILYYMLYAIALLVGATGLLGLVNALTASVLERRREIGMLRAMGATRRRVAQVFWVEGLAQGALAWGIGALVGLPLAYGFVRVLWQSVMPVDFYVDAVAFAVMLAAIVIIASLASIVPAWRASRVRIADILRYE